MRRIILGGIGPVLLVFLTIIGWFQGVAPKVIGIAWVAFFAMAIAIPFGHRASRQVNAGGLVWGYGLASGAMITSAAVFIVPGAINHHPQFGGFGIAAGVVLGYAAHTTGHRVSHLETSIESTTARLTAHALAAGSIIGIVYAGMPSLGPLLGLAIVSHKGPAGYAAAHRLATNNKPASVLLIPAAGVGITAIPAALLAIPAIPMVRALVFGFAAGIFLHVAMDFLPRCDVGGEVYELVVVEEQAHALLDRLRLHGVASVGFGGLVVYLAWMLLTL